MKMKLGAIVAAEGVLRQLADRALPPIPSYRVATICEAVAKEVERWQKQRNKLFEELGVERDATDDERSKGSTPTVRQIPAEKVPEFSKAIDDLLEMEVECVFMPLNLHMLNQTDTLKPSELILLKDFVTVD